LLSDLAAWIAQVRSLYQLYARKQNSYWMTKVADAGGDSKKLWSTLDAVLCKDRSRSRLPTDGLSANDFLNAFSSKVEAVRSSTASASAPTYTVGTSCSSVLDAFDGIDASYIQKLVLSAPNKNCALDPAPTWLVKKFAVELSPFLTILFNLSMGQGVVLLSLKRAIVVPALKKTSRDPSDMGNSPYF